MQFDGVIFLRKQTLFDMFRLSSRPDFGSIFMTGLNTYSKVLASFSHVTLWQLNKFETLGSWT